MDFSVESKYPISIFKDNDMAYSWDTIKVGWDLQRLTQDEIGKFAMDYLEQHPDMTNKYISELICGVKGDQVDFYLKKIFQSLDLNEPEKGSSEWNKEWLKWRYCIMSEMVKNIPDVEQLLTYIEGVFADFDYPEDMTGFIYYMPSEKPGMEQSVNPAEARKALVKKLKIFLEREKVRISQTTSINTLPERIVKRD